MPKVMHLNKNRKGSQEGGCGGGHVLGRVGEGVERQEKSKISISRNGEQNLALKNTSLVIILL